ncbi:Fur-regulated basic protein FbpA [Peribacillus deserti]|uniref:Fur-regulated basic protein FbpA n=1 Tax=Peribacillus deserti TaxID=673318 RepID=A0A2N5M3X5_9BACI|nr:Fur-regulated basic protein FbpA [Peribacillus deserti]PLT29069.1 Fur-regulated basic protein FbpA [Peribacillus deserti]
MPLLREAVEKKRKFIIQKLIQAGVYKPTDQEINSFTLSQLEKDYHYFILRGQNLKTKNS